MMQHQVSGSKSPRLYSGVVISGHFLLIDDHSLSDLFLDFLRWPFIDGYDFIVEGRGEVDVLSLGPDFIR